MVWLMVAVGGGLGSVLRYGMNRIAAAYAGPETVLGTLAVNLLGSFALGFLVTLALVRVQMPADFRAFLTVGVLGGFTTFSTLSYQTVHLLEANWSIAAVGSLAANVILGLALAYAGVLLARAV